MGLRCLSRQRVVSIGPYQAKGANCTLANNVENGYKKIDAVQLIGN